jgi:HD-like signal output (HDOD) protein/FixJ family two-component response regulator
MKTVLIANGNSMESKEIVDAIGGEFQTKAINSPEEFNGGLNQINLVLLDSNFTPDHGLDFVLRLKTSYIPILAVTPPDDAICAAEALKAGAFNYIVKTPHYHEILNVVIRDAIYRFDQHEEMKQVIIDLKKKISELEEQIARSENKKEGESGRTEKENAFDEVLARLKKGEINLPSPPQMQIEFEKMVKQGSSVAEISKLLRQDISICSKLISISNSALYQGIHENKTLEQAISRLGLNTAKKYVEVICNRSLYTTQKKKNLAMMEKLWKHSVSCGFASQFTCEMLRMKQADELFTMGLVHDIGKLVLLQIFSELNLDINDEAVEGACRADLAQSLSQNHGAFGAMLLKRWGFPPTFQQAALNHDKTANIDTDSRELVIVHFSNVLVKSLGYQFEQNDAAKIEESASAKALRLGPYSISKIKDQVRQHMSELKTIF